MVVARLGAVEDRLLLHWLLRLQCRPASTRGVRGEDQGGEGGEAKTEGECELVGEGEVEG